MLFFVLNSTSIAYALDWEQIVQVYPNNKAFYNHLYDEDTGTLYAATYNSTAGAMVFSWVPGVSVHTCGHNQNKDNGLGLGAAIPAVWDMAIYNEQLRVGVGNSGAAQVWTYENYSADDDWTPMSDTGFLASDTVVRSLYVTENGALYAGTRNIAAGAHAYYFNINSNQWVNSGTGSDFPASTWEITKLIQYDGSLYAGVWDATGAEVYVYDGGAATWTAVSTGEFTATDTYIADMIVFQDQLYVLTSGYLGSGDYLEVYRYDGANWAEVVGDNSTPDRGFGENNLAISMTNYSDNTLFVGTINTTTGGQVWSTSDGNTWTQEEGDGFGEVTNYAISAMEVMNLDDGSVRLAAGTYNDSGADSYWTELVSATDNDDENGISVLPKTGQVKWFWLIIGILALVGLTQLSKWKVSFQRK